MKSSTLRRLLCAAAALAVFAIASPALAAKAHKFAIILPGQVEDSDYNFWGYQVTQDLAKKFGIKTSYAESVLPADAVRVTREFIDAGYTIIGFHGGQYVRIVKKLAPKFPGVTFIMESSAKHAVPANVWNIHRHYHEGFYPIGVLAGLATRKNGVGVIAGIKLPDFKASINTISDALKATNPKAKLIYAFTGDQDDQQKARRVAEAMIDDGVDFIICMLNQGVHGVIDAAREAKHKVLFTSLSTDRKLKAPRHLAATLSMDFRPPYAMAVRGILIGASTGYVSMRPGNGFEVGSLGNVSKNVAAKVNEAFWKVLAGSIKIQVERKEIRRAQGMVLGP